MPPWAPAGTRYAGLRVRVGANVLDLLWLAAVHMAVDKIERRVREARPDVCRLVSHAEPAVTAGSPYALP